MEYLRLTYKNNVNEIKAFNDAYALGKWLGENLKDIKDFRPEDMSTKIKIHTIDNKDIIRNFKDDMSLLENIAKIVDDVKLEEERIGIIQVIKPSVGVFGGGNKNV